jgi:hypothetical protein
MTNGAGMPALPSPGGSGAAAVTAGEAGTRAKPGVLGGVVATVVASAGEGGAVTAADGAAPVAGTGEEGAALCRLFPPLHPAASATHSIASAPAARIARRSFRVRAGISHPPARRS